VLHILHGDNELASYNRLQDLIQAAKKSGQEVTQIQVKKLTEVELNNQLQQDSLFGGSRLVVVEGLHSLPPGARRKTMIQMVANSTLDIIIREVKKLTATQLKVFSSAKVEHFKLDSVVFKWLATIGSKQPPAIKLQSLQTALAQEGAEMCFAMLIRQIRLLIRAKDRQLPPMAPFQIEQLTRQAHPMTISKLLQYHRQLLDIDLHQKTSQALLPLSATLELFTVDVYSQKVSVST